MIDLEEALRRELRDRAEANDRPVVLLEPVARRVRRVRRRRVVAASALALAMAAGTGAVATAARPPAAVRTAAGLRAPVSHGLKRAQAGGPLLFGLPVKVPHGWAPVPYLGLQISVPADWTVQGNGWPMCGSGGAGGGAVAVFLGGADRPGQYMAPNCRLAANLVGLVGAGTADNGGYLAEFGPVNSDIRVRAHLAPDGVVVRQVRSAGVEVTARGPLAERVLATLTRSPRSVVLAAGPRAAVPAGWRWHHFGGIKLAAPARWTTSRQGLSVGCAGVAAATVQLSTAREFTMPGCLGWLPPQSVGSAVVRPGVVVAAGHYSAADLASDPVVLPCLRLHGMRACVLRSGSVGGVLKLAVFPPGRATPTLVEIGLAGTGLRDRAILDSIRPAS